MNSINAVVSINGFFYRLVERRLNPPLQKEEEKEKVRKDARSRL